jgi:dinuclear metal center YbgI/SA1388 family protein
MVPINDILAHLESIAPRQLQEKYDNSGLLTGDSSRPVTRVLLTLDCTENVVDEAIGSGCNLIIAHHPIIFSGLKKITGSNYIERVIIKAIKHDIAIYACHTNLDNILQGVNRRIAEKLGLRNLRVLAPKKDSLSKLVTFVPTENVPKVLDALHQAGAGQIGEYKNCSFQSTGTGTFMPTGDARPAVGEINKVEHVREERLELILPVHREEQVLGALRSSHPYEEVAYYLTRLENESQEVGAGIIGEIDQAMEPIEFLRGLKVSMNTACVRHTAIAERKVKRIAVCGGSGSFLLSKAIAAAADVFITADFKYHQFFDAEGKIIIADIGHYESEQFTKELLKEVLSKKFTTFAINFSKTNTNPISYL